MGPNRRDMFFAKMEKIKNKQFELLHSDEGSKVLLDRNIDPVKIIHQTCYKAQLFEPYESKPVNIRPLNTDCIVGCWLNFENFKSVSFKKYQFYIPFKSQWVVKPHIDVSWSSHFDTLLEVNLSMLRENALMVWMKKSATEFQKFFVVWW